MGIKGTGLLADLLGQRWTITSSPSAGATVTASVSTGSSAERITLDCLSYTFKNMSAGAFTCTTSVRDASVAGSVVASWQDVVATASSGGRHLDSLGISIASGHSLFITQDTVLASVVASVNATGWTRKSK